MRKLLYILLSLPILFAACGKKSMVLDKEEMASLMADMHIAEAVVDMNNSAFPTDSSRQALKQSIYAAHGVTSEQVDSSYVWYGYHIEDYMEVYDRTIEIIEERQRDMLTASSEQIVVAGDSVDIWPMASRLEFSQRSPSRILTFSIPADSNWRDRDVFSLRFNMASAKRPVIARMNIEYADGSTYYNLVAGKNKGMADVSVRIDSARQPVKIVGYLMANPDQNETVLLDSIALVRMREYIPTHYFSMRQFTYGAKRNSPVSHPKDSTTSSAATPTTTTPTEPRNAQHLNSSGHSAHSGSLQSAGRPAQVAPNSSGGSAAQEAVRTRDALRRKAEQVAAQEAKR